MNSLTKLKKEVEQDLLLNILPYWMENTVDDRNGGFVGQVNHTNDKIWNAPKGGILNARILWTFSACFRKYGTEKYKITADRAYNYIKDFFIDEVNGGIYWTLDHNGIPLDDRKHVYAQSFAIYGLTEYYLAFKDKKALELAKNIFELLEQKCTDKANGGYFEAFSKNWEIEKDARLSEKDDNTPKSMNTHLHILEAYTNLYKCIPSKRIRSSISDLIDIFLDHIIDKKGRSLINFFDENWKPKSQVISYGHDIEACWLLNEAEEVLGSYHRKAELDELIVSISEKVLKNGIDGDFGILNEKEINKPLDKDKDWWPQAEGIVGFLNAYQLTRNIEFTEASINLWNFIKKNMIDETFGEWHEKVSSSGDVYQLDKVREWKCPYHNTRAALQVVERVNYMLENNSSNILSEKKVKEKVSKAYVS